MVVSFEFAAYKIVLIIFSILFVFLSLYQFLIPIIPQLKLLNAKYVSYIVPALAVIQLIYVFRMKRPRIY